MENLNKTQMEELLPDYLFGRLDNETANNFKMNLPNFPEIEKELNNASEVFRKIEDLDMKTAFDKKAINLSVQVNKRLYKRKSQSAKKSFFGYAVPIAVMITLIIVFFNTNKYKNIDNSTLITNNSSKVIDSPAISVNEIQQILEEDIEVSETNNNIKNESAIPNISINEEDEIEDQFDIFDYEISEYAIFEELENLDESEFQEILSDIKNNY